jgi:hypothetical protein
MVIQILKMNDYGYYLYGAQSILKALNHYIQDMHKNDILKTIDELIISLEKDIKNENRQMDQTLHAISRNGINLVKRS